MKRTVLSIALLAAAFTTAAAPWTYRGTLNDGGKPANGSYDVRLTLINAAGTASVSQPITVYNVPVKDGSFAAEVDFAVDLSNAPAMKLKTEVSQGGSGFVSLGELSAFDPKSALAVGACWSSTGDSGGSATTNFLGFTDNVALSVRSAGGINLNGSGAINSPFFNFSDLKINNRNNVGGPIGDDNLNISLASTNTSATMSLIDSRALLSFTAPGGYNFSTGADDGLGINTSTLGAQPDFRFFETVIKNSAGDPNTDLALMNSTNRGFQIASVPGPANPAGGFFSGSFYLSEIDAQTAGPAGFTAVFVRQENGVITMNRATPAIGQAAFQVGTLCTTPICLNSLGNGAYLSTGGSWTNSSARASKTGFAPINPMSILEKVVAMPITTWTYRNAQAEGTHMGPVAEDFKASFGLSGDGKSIGTVDADGVALAAIQGLNQKLESENAALRSRLEAIEEKLAD